MGLQVRVLPRQQPAALQTTNCYLKSSDCRKDGGTIFNPHPMTTLKLTLIVLPIVEIAIFIWLLIRKDRKQKKPVARYEDYEAIFYDP